MPAARTTHKANSVTFRLDPGPKAELTRLARRQCEEAAIAARDPRSDESAVMRELETDLQEFGDEWA